MGGSNSTVSDPRYQKYLQDVKDYPNNAYHYVTEQEGPVNARWESGKYRDVEFKLFRAFNGTYCAYVYPENYWDETTETWLIEHAQDICDEAIPKIGGFVGMWAWDYAHDNYFIPVYESYVAADSDALYWTRSMVLKDVHRVIDTMFKYVDNIQ